jgi:hypothetical protein
MTPEQKAEFIALFSRPRQRGRDRFGGRLMDLVQHEDGTIGFVRNALQAEFNRAFTRTLDEIFGPSRSRRRTTEHAVSSGQQILLAGVQSPPGWQSTERTRGHRKAHAPQSCRCRPRCRVPG